MAFCIRSERKMEFQKPNQNKLGPGQYSIMDTRNKSLFVKKSPPFQSSGQRISPLIKFNNVPGPGSYDIKENKHINFDPNKKLSNIKDSKEKGNNSLASSCIKNNHTASNSQEKNNSEKKIQTIYDKINSYSILPYYHNEKYGFLSQASRFDNKCPQTNREHLYNSSPKIESVPKIRNVHKIAKGILSEKVGSLNRIISIPSKTMNGYLYEKVNNNELKRYIIQTDSSKFNLSNNAGSNLFNMSNQSITNSNVSKNTTGSTDINNLKLRLLMNKQIQTNKSCSRSELLGPGSYNVPIKEKKNILIDWSKSTKNEKENNNINKHAEIIEEMKRVGDFNFYEILKNRNKIIKRTIKYITPLNKDIIKNMRSKKIYSNRSSFIPLKDDVPGPGYYTNDIVKQRNENIKLKKLKKEAISSEDSKTKILKIPNIHFKKYQFKDIKNYPSFGSTGKRMFQKNNTMENLGPTTYYLQKNKFESIKKKSMYNQLLSYREKNDPKRNNTKFNLQSQNDYNSNTQRTDYFGRYNLIGDIDRNIPGPGTYDLSHNFIKPTFSTTQFMSTKIKRFSESDNESPGPGSYENIKCLGNDKKLILKKIKYKENKLNEKIKEEKFKNIVELNKVDVPGAGSYDIDKKNSISYKIYSKFNLRQSYISPFLNSSSRFSIENDNKVSPATYDPYKFDNYSKHNQTNSFNKSERFNKILNNDVILNGPGSYKLDINWNKKTYNILFT